MNKQRSVAVAVALGAILLLAGGCSLLVDADRAQCKSDGDCAALGGEFAGTVCIESFCKPSPRWVCLDSPAEPGPTGGEFNVSFLVRDTVNQKPKVGLNVRLCRRLDVACTDVVGSAGVTNDQGSVALKAPAGFDGYARFEGGDSIPTMYFFNPPVAQDLTDVTVSLSSFAVTAGLVGLTGITQQPERGIVLASVTDCTGSPASGIQFSSNIADDDPHLFYSANNLPSAMASETDAAGYGGLVNVSPGTVTLTAAQSGTGREVDRITVLVQAGMLTTAKLVPRGK